MSAPSRIRADTHVHFYDCFDESAFLEAADSSLCVAQGENEEKSIGALFLTETQGANWFERLRSGNTQEFFSSTGWNIENTSESKSVILENVSGRRLIVIAGRQIVCCERIEVLALGIDEDIDDGQPIRDVIEKVDRAGALPVIPWGVGKWIGSRGLVIGELIRNPPCWFALGDIGGRLSILPEPQLFDFGRKRGRAILPGTDILPMPWNENRVGSYCLEFSAPLDFEAPCTSLTDILKGSSGVGSVKGNLEGLASFIRNQFSLRLLKRRR
jgi:hypothetical protein